MKKLLIPALLISALSLSGCASMIKGIAHDDCNTTKAYNSGVSDAVQGLDENTDYSTSNFCDAAGLNQQQENNLNTKYEKGYRRGLEQKHHRHHKRSKNQFTNQYMAQP